MGAWSNEIRDNDTYLDVEQDYKDLREAGKSYEEAVRIIFIDYSAVTVATDVQVIISLTDRAVEEGLVDEHLFNRAIEVIESGTDETYYIERQKRRAITNKWVKALKEYMEGHINESKPD